jgi:hypothetical protein
VLARSAELMDAIQPASEIVLAYARRMGLAGQLALLLMEFIQIAEKSYFRSLAYYAGFEEACSKAGMAFSSSVVLDETKNETVATMGIDL